MNGLDIEPGEWTCGSTDTLKLSLALPDKLLKFQPLFTYPIFGESEQIFGYKGLSIDLAFDCKSLKTLLVVKYKEKLSKDVKNIEDIMSKFLNKGDYIINSESKWIESIENEEKESGFELPIDKIVNEYERDGKKYKVYKFEDLYNEESIGHKLLKRSQIFTLLFIEGGSYIDLKDKRWGGYFIYESNDDDEKDVFIGFVTYYKYWKFINSKEFDNNTEGYPYRGRISQIVILPPFQGKGHGIEIYKIITNEWIKDFKCYEITIEDPNEAMDEIRDRVDLQRLMDGNSGESLKLTKRQNDRIMEMMELRKGGENSKELKKMIFTRVYRNHADSLIEMKLSIEDIRSKLEEVYGKVVEGYQIVINQCISSNKRKQNEIM